MNTKTCKGCGWVFPINYPAGKCPFCGTKFDDYTNDGRNKRFYEKSKRVAQQRYDDWIKKFDGAFTHTLTEDEWLKACRYFGGCALCGSEYISTRHYFIPFREGGKYTAYNIIPVCEECTLTLKRVKNPFKYMDKELIKFAKGSRQDGLERLKYIEEFLSSNM